MSTIAVRVLDTPRVRLQAEYACRKTSLSLVCTPAQVLAAGKRRRAHPSSAPRL